MDPAAFPYRDASLPIERRIADLIGRMTLEEKACQLDQYHGCQCFAERTYPTHGTAMDKGTGLRMDRVRELLGDRAPGCIHDLYPPSAEAINQLQRYAVEETRLGIPILFSEEGLHGLCGPGNTVFPQALSLASSWNPAILEATGRAIARELRAYGIHESFSPVIDLARDPRWGRMEETYGEDAWLSARLAVAMVRGMQGEDLRRDDAIVAEPKHFAAYGIPRGGINTSSAHIGLRDLWTYVLPVFEAAFVEGGALGCMCSYNSIDGVPCAGDAWLLTEVLRKQWGFRGFVRSDLGAVRRLDWAHHTADTPEECIRQSVTAGLDMQYYDFESEVWQGALCAMVRDGRMAMDTVDRAAARVLRVKFELGLFENPYTSEALVGERVRCAAHVDTALEGARQALCLMKNEGGLLPLSPDIKTLAVVGPSAAAARMGDYTPTVHGFEPVSVLEGIRALAPRTKVLHAKGTGVLEGELDPIPAEFLHQPDGGGPGLRAQYFNNLELAGEPVLERVDPMVDYNWMFTKPANAVAQSAFSVRWEGELVSPHAFDGFLGTSSLDSMRLWVDGNLLVDGWDQGRNYNTNLSKPFRFEAGRRHALRLEFKRDHSAIQVRLGWNQGADDFESAVSAAAQAEAAVVCVGDSRETCGEGRDRSDLNLPGRQLDLVKAVHATGTPVVLVLQIGRAMTLTWETEHVPAILNAWFPGEQGGRAVAEALFGVYNPAGRLPVSFPRSVGQLPLHHDVLPFGRQGYIDCEKTPLFPFGHGLSYTTFAYGPPEVSPAETGPEGNVVARIAVTNTGARPGDEVVQCYLRDCVSSVVRPERMLCGFERVHLEPRETRTVSFTIGPRHTRLLDRHMAWTVEPGEFRLYLGGGPGHEQETGFRVVLP